MTNIQKRILRALEDGALTDNEISQRTGIPAQGVRSSVLALRKLSLVSQVTSRKSPVPVIRLVN